MNQQHVIQVTIQVDCKIFDASLSAKNKIFCQWCDEPIHFRKDLRSYIGIKIPLDFVTDEVHNCLCRGWSATVPCKNCNKLLKFNNSIRGKSGKKIPHNLNLSRHKCVTMQKSTDESYE